MTTNDTNRARSLTRLRSGLEVLATLLVIAVCVVMLNEVLRPRRPVARPARAGSPPVIVPKEPVSIETAAIKGNAKARVALIEYSDFQCPFCGKFAREILPAVDKEFVQTGRVMIAFRHLPLETIHPFALKAAEAATCAGRQGKFWEMHDELFRGPEPLDVGVFQVNAESLRLNSQEFARCITGTTTEQIRADAADARALSIVGTPTFFIGTVQSDMRVKVISALVGAASIEQFQSAINGALDAGRSN